MNRIGKPGWAAAARMLALSGQAAAQGKVGPRKDGPRSTAPCGQRPTGLEIPKGMENWPVVCSALTGNPAARTRISRRHASTVTPRRRGTGTDFSRMAQKCAETPADVPSAGRCQAARFCVERAAAERRHARRRAQRRPAKNKREDRVFHAKRRTAGMGKQGLPTGKCDTIPPAAPVGGRAAGPQGGLSAM